MIYERRDTSSTLSATSATQAVPVSANDLDLATLAAAAATKIVAIHRQQQSQRQLVSCLPRTPLSLHLQTHNFPACRCSNTIFMCNQNENKPRKWRREKKRSEAKANWFIGTRHTQALIVRLKRVCLPLSTPKSTRRPPLGVSLPQLLAPADYADWVKWNF